MLKKDQKVKKNIWKINKNKNKLTKKLMNNFVFTINNIKKEKLKIIEKQKVAKKLNKKTFFKYKMNNLQLL